MWYSKSKNDVLSQLNTDAIKGLSSFEATSRLEKYGYNKFAKNKKKSIFILFFEQINDAMIYILIIAAIISATIGETSDAIIIGVVILLNAVIGLIQESKAEKALDELQKLSTPKALVKRDSELVEINSEMVVPGDILIIDAGRYIPCDLRLIESANLKLEESALTGESVPSDKDATLTFENKKVPIGDQKNMAFMSTLCTYGRGVGVAVSTGMDTEMGKIASMLKKEEKELTPLQKKLAQLGKLLGFGALGICALIFAIGMLRGRDLFEMFLTSISLAVAAIPEGLPAIVTIVLAIGVQKMIKENAIVRKLPAVETLGSVNVICSDKTGTLTQNKMTVTKFYSDKILDDANKLNIDNTTHRLLLENLVLCNDATYSEDSKTGDPTEIALLQIGYNYNLLKNKLNEIHLRINEIPFDSDRKLMTTLNKYNGENYVMTKGAIDSILKVSKWALIDGKEVDLTEELKKELMKISNRMSDEALRVISAAYKKINSSHISIDEMEKDLVFIGMVGMIDPPRMEVKDSISLCKESGIRTVMITGDHKNTAFAIAKDLGIAEDENQAIFGHELDSMSDDELNSKIDDLRIFARVSPEHKVRIVKALKAKGNIVSMTGDGVNDAPSLKAADIGVAMGITGTDVSKGAADLILTDDNFSTIVRAVEEGRNIYNNIKKTIIFLLSCNIGEIIAIFTAIILNWSSPLSPIHLLWINLITDTLPALALGVDPSTDDVMKEKPRSINESIFHGDIGNLVFNGFIIATLTLTAFKIGEYNYPGSLMHAQTMAFMVMSISELVRSLNMRSKTKSIFTIGLFTNKFLIYAIGIGIFLQGVVVLTPGLNSLFKVTPLTLSDWALVASLSLVPLVANELIKIVRRAKTN
ncbi:cation-translocating P-type ATPase [Clostridium sp. DL1XJH146]